MMTHTITRTHTPTGKKEVLMGITAESGREARLWFASAIATMLEEDPSGEYRMVNLDDFPGSPPDWYLGDGFYDSNDNLVLRSGEPFPDMVIIADWEYRLTP